MANILIVHAHHEPRSFSSALAKTASETLAGQGHEIVLSDLYAMRFNPVSDRRNFTTVADPTYLKQQNEEGYASEHGGFVSEIESEMRKIEKCDLLIFSFPLWWFGMPAILKGWLDRVFAYGRIYGRGHWYENGLGQGKRAMVLMTTGGAATTYGGHGLHPALDTLLTPIHHGIFWFNGFSPLSPFVAWSAAHGSDSDRQEVLKRWRIRLQDLFEEPVLELPPAAEFDRETFIDMLPRFIVTVARKCPADDEYSRLIPAEIDQLETYRREGRLLRADLTPSDSSRWRGFFLFRERTQADVLALCESLPLASYLDFEIVQIDGDSMKWLPRMDSNHE
jgi:NAD(P)H dehydrogenase (quinone)